MNHHFPESEEFFNGLIGGIEGLALLVFTASFCGPTKLLVDTIHEFSLDRPEFPIDIITIDVEKLPTITRKYQVKGTPQLVMLWRGEPVSSRIGTMGFEDFTDYVNSELEAA